MSEFIFDEWVKLYNDDPDEFERKRQEIIELEISRCPGEYRNDLRLLQAECDKISLMNSPLDATIKISQLMIEKLGILSEKLEELDVKSMDL